MVEPDLLLKIKIVCDYHRYKGECSCSECPLSYEDPYSMTIECGVVPTLYGSPCNWTDDELRDLAERVNMAYANLATDPSW